MRQPSLYAYFDSKSALYERDVRRRQPQLLTAMSLIDLPDDPREALKLYLGALADFAVATGRGILALPSGDPRLRAESRVLRDRAGGARPRRRADEAAGVVDPGDIDCLVA
jgi:AcrR family transcriptional regulator